MQVEAFYKTNTKKTIPLHLLTPNACNEMLSTFEKNCLAAQQFTGEVGNIGLISDTDGFLNKVYIGAGEKSRDTEALACTVNLIPAGVYEAAVPLSHEAQVVWSLSQYRFDRYKAAKQAPRQLLLTEAELPVVTAEAAAIFLVRDLINTPTDDMGPEQLSEIVAKIAANHDAHFEEWVGDALLEANFPAIYAVGRGAAAQPRLLSLTYGNPEHPSVTLVGKGVCFDTGGLDIKPASGMRLMKKDMGGAAHVIALADWLMKQRLPIYLRVFVPAVENAVDGNAYRPGDILTMRNHTTVEVHNTDAEGRLVLADAMTKACESNVDLLIDFATLTGAARVALGTEIAALFCNDEALASDLLLSSLETNEPMWRLPLFEPYRDLLRSSFADFSNCSDSAFGGAITAALFLQHFMKPGVPWVHLDVMAWNERNKPGKPEGGEAMALRAIGYYLMKRYGAKPN